MSSMTSYPFASSQSGLCNYNRPYLTSPAPTGGMPVQRPAFGIQDLLGLGVSAQPQTFSPTQFLPQDSSNLCSYGYQGYSGACAVSAQPSLSHPVVPAAEHHDFHSIYNPSSWHRATTLSGYGARPEDSVRYSQESYLGQPTADVSSALLEKSGYGPCQTPSGMYTNDDIWQIRFVITPIHQID